MLESSKRGDEYIHVSPQLRKVKSIRATQTLEVNCSLQSSGWKIALYMAYSPEAHSDEALYAGRAVRFFHTQTRSYLSIQARTTVMRGKREQHQRRTQRGANQLTSQRPEGEAPQTFQFLRDIA